MVQGRDSANRHHFDRLADANNETLSMAHTSSIDFTHGHKKACAQSTQSLLQCTTYLTSRSTVTMNHRVLSRNSYYCGF